MARFIENTVDNENEIPKVEVKKNDIVLDLKREQYKGRDGRIYWSYYITGTVRGKTVRADITPKDSGGFTVLDIIFENTKTAKFITYDETMTDSSGKRTSYSVYEAYTTAEDGSVYSLNVKPKADSDKTLLRMIVDELITAKSAAGKSAENSKIKKAEEKKQ